MGVVRLLPFFAALTLAQLGSSDLSLTDLLTEPTLTCVGTSTFTGYIPVSTVTITVDGNYTYTGAANASMPTAAIYYTPLPACESVVVPEPSTTEQSSLSDILNSTTSSSDTTISTTSISESTTTWTQTWTSVSCVTTFADANSTIKTGAPYANSTITGVQITSCSSQTYTTTSIGRWSAYSTSDVGFGPSSSPRASAQTTLYNSLSSAGPAQPMIPSADATNNEGAPGVSAETTGAARSFVATVTVTKKTPVAAPADNTGPQIAFPGETDGVGSPNGVTPTGAGNTGGANTGGSKGTTTGGNKPTAGNNIASPTLEGNKNSGGGNNPTGANDNPTGSSNNSPSGNNNENNNNDSGNKPTGSNNGGGGLGSIINSAFNSPWTSVGVSTSYGAASATVTLVNGVPVQIDSSSVYIGGSYVALPTGTSTATVVINGQTFSVGPSVVIGGSNTLEINRPESISYSPVQAATLAASTITQNGIVVTIEPSVAIVDGKTYAIGLNAKATTVVVAGQTVILNSNGVAFASTTYAPAITTAAAYVMTTIGDLTFSLDQSEAIISGTTYRIGAGAVNSIVTTEIDGTTIIFGPSGVILPSTTIAPTGVSLSTSDTKSSRTSDSATVKAVSNASGSGNAAPNTSRPPSYLSNTVCTLVMILSLTTLPLGLLL